MNKTHKQKVLSRLNAIYAPRPEASVSEWATKEIIFNEPNCQGRFSLNGREYLRKAIDWWADEDSTDMVLVFGTRTGKTRSIFVGLGWTIEFMPCRCLYVMPNTDGAGGAKNASRTRIVPMIRASKVLARHIPVGVKRHEFKMQQLMLNGMIIDLTGSNSAANLASNPARIVVQDEVDKFDKGGREEASSVRLADERTREFGNPKRVKTSTPTLSDGLIWDALSRTNMYRRFMPCPSCKKLVVLAWSKTMTVFPFRGDEAFMVWDKEARRDDGSWDLDRVERSARHECPHCGHHITDGEKTSMDRDGEWKLVKEGAPRSIGMHLPSMYSSSPQTNAGAMALRFLTAKRSFEGLQSFINSDLAEPFENQDTRNERLEVVVKGGPEAPAGTTTLLTVDVQQGSPGFWWVKRSWFPGGHSRLLDWGAVNTWAQLDKVQGKDIPHTCVGIDSGDQDSNEALYESDVYSRCLDHGEKIGVHNIKNYIHRGWFPMKGMGRAWSHKNRKTGAVRPIGLFNASIPNPGIRLYVLAFNSETMFDMLDKLRKGDPSGIKWELNDRADDIYFTHMDGKIKGDLKNGRTWHSRSPRWPDHLLDCEKMQIALALFLKLLPWGLTGMMK